MEQSSITNGLITGLKWGLVIGAVFAGGITVAALMGATIPAGLLTLAGALGITTNVAAISGALACAGTVLMQSLAGAATLGPVFAGIGGALSGVSTLYNGWMANKAMNQQEHIAMANVTQGKAPKRSPGAAPSHDFASPAGAAPSMQAQATSAGAANGADATSELSQPKESTPAWVNRTHSAAASSNQISA